MLPSSNEPNLIRKVHSWHFIWQDCAIKYQTVKLRNHALTKIRSREQAQFDIVYIVLYPL